LNMRRLGIGKPQWL